MKSLPENELLPITATLHLFPVFKLISDIYTVFPKKERSWRGHPTLQELLHHVDVIISLVV